MIDNRMLTQLIFWGVWLVIPLIWEILGSAAAAVLIFYMQLKRRRKYSKESARSKCDKGAGMPYLNGMAMPVAADIEGEVHSAGQNEMDFYPTVSIVIPVYNSEASLEVCLESIAGQSYPVDRLEVLLVDNGSTDRSREVFEHFQMKHRELKIWWNSSEKGKSRALNMGVFSGSGRYIVNIDSDGFLDNSAINNIVRRFESDCSISAMTGVVLTDYTEIGNGIKANGTLLSKVMKTVRKCELFEYCESFLVGRSFESIYNHLFTMAGAFSCFRRATLLKTQLYNTETIGEDAHMTNQIRTMTGGRIELCSDAFYFTEPIEDLNKLYVQRQRWQRAELEVAGLFRKSHSGGIISFFRKPDMRRLISSHTLAFPRLIWMFAMIYLYFINYPLKLLAGANLLLYTTYVLLSLFNIATACIFLGDQKETRSFVIKHFYICAAMPLYRIMLYWMRLAGIINSLTTPSRWRTKTFSEEITDIRSEAACELHRRFAFIFRLKKMINSRSD